MLVVHGKLVAAALDGTKHQQRRAVYGYRSDKCMFGEIKALRTERWDDITEEDARREGYPNIATLIERMHRGMESDQDQAGA